MSVKAAEQFEQLISQTIPADEDKILARIAFKYGVIGHGVRFLYIVWKVLANVE